MPNPIPPSLFKDVIPASSGSVCDKLLKVLTVFPQRFYSWYSWKYLESGEFSDEFKDMLCAACGPCTGGPNNPENCSLEAPTLVAATDGTSGTDVVISWAAVNGASYYDVYRSTSNTSAAAVKINSNPVTGLSYSDTYPAGFLDTLFYYFIKAVKTDGANLVNDYCEDETILCTSEFSGGDSGYAHSGGGSGGAGSRVYSSGNGILCTVSIPPYFNLCNQTTTSFYSFQVPEGKTSVVIKCWGGGGAGGTGAYGGGGGGAEYTTATVAVTPLEILNIAVGFGGSIALQGASYPGFLSSVRRGSDILISAKPGSNGLPNGTAGAGGTGGVFGTCTSGTTAATGVNGTAGTAPTTPGAGGNPGLVNGDFGKGGAGSTGFGKSGRVEISWT
jgi:hypothetical protein